MSQATQTTKLPATRPTASIGGTPATGDDLARRGPTGGSGGGASGGGGSTTLILVAAGVALLAVLAVNLYVEYVKSATRPDEMTIYRLRVPVTPGERLKEKLLIPMQVPRQYDEALGHPVQDYQLANYLADDPPKRFTQPGTEAAVLTHEMLTEEDSERIDRDILPQYRFVALPVDANILPGQILTEMRVDLYAPFVVNGRLQVIPVIENVEVKLVGSRSADQEASGGGLRGSGRYKTLTVQVTPEQGEDLENILLMAAGDFRIHLRNPADDETPRLKTDGINPALLKMIGSGSGGEATPGA